MTVELEGTYSEPGATSDGGETVTITGSVDTDTLGSYTITYTATDANGNTGTATRTVNVVDTTAPVIALEGANPMECRVRRHLRGARRYIRWRRKSNNFRFSRY